MRPGASSYWGEELKEMGSSGITSTSVHRQSKKFKNAVKKEKMRKPTRFDQDTPEAPGYKNEKATRAWAVN